MPDSNDGFLLDPKDPKYRKPRVKKVPVQIPVTTTTEPKVKKPKKPSIIKRYLEYWVEVITA